MSVKPLRLSYDAALYKKLILLALPIMGSYLLQTLYNLADTFFLGKLGKEAVSAPSIAFNIIFFMIIFGTGFASAGTTLISQSKGKKDDQKVEHYTGQTMGILFIVSCIISILGFFMTDTFLQLLQVPEGLTYAYTRVYMRIIFLGMPYMFISFAFQAIMQGVGDSLTPLYLQIGTVILNIVLDYLLIFGIGIFPVLGVQGAAIATVTARGTAGIVSLIILFSGKKAAVLHLSALIPSMRSWKLIGAIGLPSSIGQGISALGFTTLQGVVNTFGPSVIAAFGVGGRIIGLFNMPSQGLSQATAIMVGQHLGAKKYDQASKIVVYGLGTVFVFITIGMSLTFFYGNYFVKFFVDDPEVIGYGYTLFRIVSVSVVFFALFTVLVGAFQGGGDTKPIMFFNIFRLWGVRVPAALILSKVCNLGPEGIWWAMFLSNFSVALFMFLLYRTERWKYRLNPDTI
ncbi:MAG: MATE family efflux transporter [Spirochaetales bacterium]|jgi:putative MATE family efflux protein|nr:MATE family efflux transporter [Spirochaetales bacterium]